MKNKKNMERNRDYSVTIGLLDFNDIKNYIYKIISWYNIKFPNSDLEVNNNKVNVINKDNKTISDYMTANELYSRLSTSVINSLRCYYSSNFECNYGDIGNDKYEEDDYIYIQLLSLDKNIFLRDQSKDCFIVADKKGDVIDYIGDNKLLKEVKNNTKKINLIKLLKILKSSNNNDLDYQYLENTVNNHNNDLIVRSNIIDTILKALIISANNLEYGYFRALEFLKDFCNYYKLEMDKDYIYNIIKNLDKKSSCEINGKKINLKLEKNRFYNK